MAGPAEDLPSDTPSIPAAAAADAAPISPSSEVPPVGADPPVVTPDLAAAPVAEVPADASPEAAAGSEPTLLDKFDEGKKAEAEPKPEEKPADDAAKPEEKPADAPADELEKPAEVAEPDAAPVDYWADVVIPETLTLDDTKRGEVTAAFDLLRTDPAKGSQALINLHNQTMTDYADHVGREQVRVWNETRSGWRNEVMADPILGGAGHQTEMAKVAAVRDSFASTAKPGTEKYEADMADFNTFLRVTGAGDHPAFLRFLHNAHRFVREAAPPPPDPKPPKDIGKAPGRKGLGSIYTHPTSNPE